MITLRIENWFQRNEMATEEDPFHYEVEPFEIKPYNREKWKDGKLYEFKTLRDVINFIDSCDIDFTEECKATFCKWDWKEIDLDYRIDSSEENLIILEISMHEEWID